MMHDLNEKFDNNIRYSIWHATGNDIDDETWISFWAPRTVRSLTADLRNIGNIGNCLGILSESLGANLQNSLKRCLQETIRGVDDARFEQKT
jgi:hypothetical protein